MGKPLVFVGTVGLMPKTINGRPAHEKQARAGDLIVISFGEPIISIRPPGTNPI
jgi:phosphoribosylformylglycinamidine synthase